MTADLHRIDHLDPGQLAGRIRRVLDDVGLCFHEQWVLAEDPFFVVELRDLQFPEGQQLLTAAGAGASRTAALVDAHLRALALTQGAPHTVIGRRYGLMPELLVPPDEVHVPIGEIDHVPGLRGPDDQKLPCVPFYDAMDDREVLLPAGVIADLCGRVGLCSGVTPQAALVTGICDVIQRFVADRTLSDEDLALPDIPKPQVQEFEAFAPVAGLGHGPTAVVVKDCTFGGRLPVVALILFYKELGKYVVSHGAAPTLDRAIARCLDRWNLKQSALLAREQGDEADAFEELLGEGALASRCSGGDIAEHLALSIFRPRGEPGHRAAFLERAVGPEEELSFLVRLLREGGHRLLVRDLSFLGLPSFLVYVPGMSDWGVQADPLATARTRSAARQVLLSLKGSTPERFRGCALGLEELAHKAAQRRQVAREAIGIAVDPEAGFFQLLDTDYLLAELWRGAGEPGRAAACLRRHLASLSAEERGGVRHWDYYWSAWAFLQLTSLDVPRTEATGLLTDLFGEARAWELTEDIGRKENAFGYYATPVCGDCEPCPIRQHCCYERWQTVAGRLKQRMDGSPREQGALARLFRGG